MQSGKSSPEADMSESPSHEPRVRVNRPVDPSTIRAVGFDLDHTLAVYDDDRVNALAAAETLFTLVDDRHYPEALRHINYDGRSTARGLHLDLGRALVTKLDSTGRVLRARHAGAWLEQVDTVYAAETLAWPSAHPIHSPFDLPTAFLYNEVARVLASEGAAIDGLRLCKDIRIELDRSHTVGHLKHRVMKDLGSFVAPLDGFAGRLMALRERGVRTFVLTNSEDVYAVAVLDHLFPEGGVPGWRELFDIVFVGAKKPDFFTGTDAGTPVTTDDRLAGDIGRGGSAGVIETRLGAAPGEVLYVGDHAAYDILAAAAHGWCTAHVVPEMLAAADGSEWGPALEENGEPTWFGALARKSADAVVASVYDVVGHSGELQMAP